MARTSLRMRIEAIGIGEKVVMPKDYEEASVRNTASRVGRTTGRSFSVEKNIQNKTFAVTRIA